jgi:hypothetical protein
MNERPYRWMSLQQFNYLRALVELPVFDSQQYSVYKKSVNELLAGGE